jgi:hypothetical protein
MATLAKHLAALEYWRASGCNASDKQIAEHLLEVGYGVVSPSTIRSYRTRHSWSVPKAMVMNTVADVEAVASFEAIIDRALGAGSDMGEMLRRFSQNFTPSTVQEAEGVCKIMCEAGITALRIDDGIRTRRQIDAQRGHGDDARVIDGTVRRNDIIDGKLIPNDRATELDDIAERQAWTKYAAMQDRAGLPALDRPEWRKYQ